MISCLFIIIVTVTLSFYFLSIVSYVRKNPDKGLRLFLIGVIFYSIQNILYVIMKVQK